MISNYLMISHSAANRAVYIDTIDTRTYSRNVDFRPATALDFGLHVRGQVLLIHEINGN